jgi:uncharacterized protein (DUF302 family)
LSGLNIRFCRPGDACGLDADAPPAFNERAGKMAYYFSKVLLAPFDEVVARVKAALALRGFGVLSEIDVAATLKSKLGVEIGSYRILGACNPGYAYEALKLEPFIGTMLPCNVIIREEAPGHVEVAAIDPIASMQAIDNRDLHDVAREVRAKLQEAVAAL